MTRSPLLLNCRTKSTQLEESSIKLQMRKAIWSSKISNWKRTQRQQSTKKLTQLKQLLNLMKHASCSTSCLEIKAHSHRHKDTNSCQQRMTQILLLINSQMATEEVRQTTMLLQCSNRTTNTLLVASNTAIRRKTSRATKMMNFGTRHRKVLLIKVVTELLTIIENCFDFISNFKFSSSC